MERIRLAGLNEKRCIIREHLKTYNTIVSIGTYHGPAEPSRNDIITALKACVVEHSALSIVISGAETESPRLNRAATVNLDKHIDMVEEDWSTASLRRILTCLHNKAVVEDPEEPQWRVTAIFPHPIQPGKFQLAFACSHALFDGMSLAAFQSTFLRALQNVPSTSMEANPIHTVPSDLQVLPPMENVGKLSISWSFLLSPLVNEYFPKPLVWLLGMQQNNGENVWLGASKRPAKKPSAMPPTAVHVTSISPEILKRVLSASKFENVRLTALLQHLVARALTRSLDKRGLDYTTFLAQAAINLRGALGKGDGQMANYVSSLTEPIIVDGERLDQQGFSSSDWDSARRLTERLGQASKTLADQSVGLLSYLSNFKEWVLKNGAVRSDLSFEVSNLGVFDGDDKEGKGWRVEEMAFSQSANAAGQPLSLNVASAKNGSLFMVYTWWPGMLDVADEEVFVEDVAKDVVAELEVIGK